MFQVQESAEGDRTIVDLERGVSLEFIGGLGRMPGTVHTLTTPELVVPFEVCRTQDADAEFYLTRFYSFGRLFSTPTGPRIEPVDFPSQAARHRLQLLAAEALLVFGSFYNGLAKPDGYNRVDVGEKTYTLSSFGYASASS